MRLHKTPLLILILLFSLGTNGAVRAEQRTLQTFGVQARYGQPVYPLPSNVALGLFNPDPLLDVAYCSDGKMQVYQNFGNGYFGPVYERPTTGDIVRMEWRKERTFGENMFDPFSWGELHIWYKDGRTEMLTHEQMMQPELNLTFPHQIPMTPPLDFREVWRSESQTQPSTFMALGDIDNDGRIEIAYAFYEWSNDSIHLVIYECVKNDSFVVDWDSVMTRMFGPYTISDVDNDGRKEIVLTYHPGGGTFSSRVVLLECIGQRRYRFYDTNIAFDRPPFKVIDGDVDHDGIRELVLHTNNPSAPPGQDATFIYISEFSFKSSTTIFFSIQVARYAGYTFDMAVGQIDGVDRDEIIPAGGSFGVNEPVPIDYLWYNGTSWIVRQVHTGLQSGTTAPMFVNLDSDTAKELFIGAVGPVGHGSSYALDYISDTTWRVLWADSSLRNTPLSVNAGILGGQFVVAGANTWDRSPSDTLYTELHAYQPSGVKLGIWRRDTASIQNFQIMDIDNDGKANLITPVISHLIRDHLAVYEYYGTTDVLEPLTLSIFELSQNYPNPFNPTTTFTINLPVQSVVRVCVYDILGREVITLINGEKSPGAYTQTWHGTNGERNPVGSGVYFVRMVAVASYGKTYEQTRKVLLLR